jgi:hypothetical protein
MRSGISLASNLAAVLLSGMVSPASQPLHFARFANDLADLERLSQLEDAPTRMISTFDRAGGNNDALVGAWRKGDVYTIADIKGPGVVRRFYSARPGGHLRIFIDDNPEPLVNMPCEDFFSGRIAPFLRPAVGPMGGANYSYFPIPFARSIRIQTTALRPAEFPYGVYYQLSYQLFPAETPVRSLALPLQGPDAAAWAHALSAWSAPGVDPRPATAGQITEAKELRIEPGQRADLFRVDSGGVIDRFYLKFQAADAFLLRSTLLKMRWDDETGDGVDCPVGDFFGNSYSQTPYRSLPMGLTADGYYSYLSMPFGRRARITIVNQGAAAITLASRVVYRRRDSLPPGVGLFHAKWRRQEVVATGEFYENRSGENNYVALDARGPGRYLGLNLNVFNRHTAWWGEGDPMIFVDNEPWPPAIHGTGTEEYFNDAWGFHQFTGKQRERAITPVSGVLVGGVDEPNQCFGGNAVFTFHLADSVAFRDRIKVTIEHGQEQNDLTNDYASVAYWYARPRARDFFVMRPAWERTNIPAARWPALRKQATLRHLQWLRETLAEWAAAIPYEPDDDRLARPRAVFLQWFLEAAPQFGIPAADRDAMRRRWLDFKGTEPERRKIIDGLLLELAQRLHLVRD